jgi:beta-glucan synthesis-associated protein KRE6
MSPIPALSYTYLSHVVNAILPGESDVYGLWPAGEPKIANLFQICLITRFLVWSLGNLGRAGYGATLDGMWPYSYDSCDVGTLANQTLPDGTPRANTIGNDPTYDGALSYLPGQRLSACTCPGEIHPGPIRSDGN